jgi:hypothetical protein
MNKKVSIVHIYLYGMLKREGNGSRVIHISRIHPIVKWLVRVPRKYQVDIIKELVELGFLKKVDRDNYEIVSPSRCLSNSYNRPPIDSLGFPLW